MHVTRVIMGYSTGSRLCSRHTEAKRKICGTVADGSSASTPKDCYSLSRVRRPVVYSCDGSTDNPQLAIETQS